MNKETKIGYIYSLTCCNRYLVYYGSTTRPLNERLASHKHDVYRNRNVSSKILFEWGDVKINMIEEIEYEDKKDLIDREAYYIRNLKCVNKRIPNRTKKEYYCDNKEKIKEYFKQNKKDHNKKKKEYYQKNKDKIKERKKEKITCDCGSELRKVDITRHKKTQKHKVYEFLKEIENSNINLVV